MSTVVATTRVLMLMLMLNQMIERLSKGKQSTWSEIELNTLF